MIGNVYFFNDNDKRYIMFVFICIFTRQLAAQRTCMAKFCKGGSEETTSGTPADAQ